MIAEFCHLLNMKESDVLGRSRKQSIATARHIYFWLMYQSGYNYLEIGRLNGRSHATIINSIKRVDSALEVKDKTITKTFIKVQHLRCCNIKKQRNENMSKNVNFLQINQPLNLVYNKQGEEFGFEQACETCSGRGGWFIDSRSPDYDIEKDEYYKACPVCKGTGKVQAKVVVSWDSVGEVKQEFKTLEHECET